MIYDSSDSVVQYALRFGEVAIQKGYITVSALEDALAEQIASGPSVNLKPRKMVGEILFEKGYITIHQLEAVLEEIISSRNRSF